jgi:PTH2 family peptidyl-tRNA hydrolase
MRKDLKMRRGKECAQAAHAAMAWLVEILYPSGREADDGYEKYSIDLSVEEEEWLNGLHTKVCLQVNSEAELMAVHDAAKAVGLTAHIITDVGLTEFGGVPTRTCLAIGPDLAEDIDKVTGHLKLY